MKRIPLVLGGLGLTAALAAGPAVLTQLTPANHVVTHTNTPTTCTYPAQKNLTISAPATAPKGTVINITGTYTQATCPVPGALVYLYVKLHNQATFSLTGSPVLTDVNGAYSIPYELENANDKTTTFKTHVDTVYSAEAATLSTN